MKYLTVFKLDNFEAAEVFTSKKAAETFVQDCAKAAKTKALKNQENESYILAVSDKSGKTYEINVEIQNVDATVKYELNYTKDGQNVETSYYTSRKALVTAAKKILDKDGYEASTAETEAGKWSIRDAEKNLDVTLTAKLVVMGSEQENVVAAYDSVDLPKFCKQIDSQLALLAATKSVLTAEQLKAARKKGLTNLGIGLAIAAAGGLLTLFSYQSARPGEKYTVYTGLIVIGIIDAICGLYQLINPKSALPKDKKRQ